MRVDINGPAASQIASEQSASSKKVADHNRANTQFAEDTTSFSSDTVGLSALTSKAMETPEIRQDKVDSLRQSIQAGSYKIEPDKIADGILKEYGS
jgi:flagellar biosynthesis anti-sigma factor FlgM